VAEEFRATAHESANGTLEVLVRLCSHGGSGGVKKRKGEVRLLEMFESRKSVCGKIGASKGLNKSLNGIY
jgi:hypothetical protein